ncbi:hypothetical protein EDB83DRAFT_2514277 [Lactarius deliciosus]|nr:hypothetical protein EDB83DRAFT_2320526 [Lactarius deliciosus]KAH9077562.1 hypothetical protein EDB83DRAFT_2514277 [Lactarius deliciosus]
MALDDELSSSSGSDHDGSDTEDLELLALAPNSIPLPADLSVQQLREILKTSQLDHQTLFDKYKSLKIKYEELVASSSLKKKKLKWAGTVEDETEILRAGARFTVFGEPWVDRIVFAIPFPGNVDPLDRARYDNGTTEKLALTAELYKSLPKHLQKALANDKQRDAFRDIFLKKLGQERATSAHAARANAARVLQLETKFFEKDFDRTNAPELQKLVESPAEPDKKYPIFPPLIFPNHDVHSIHPFKCDALLALLRVILYGPSSINSTGEATSSTRKRASKAALWNVNAATPGMIAFAATLLLYACSPDDIFSDKSRGRTGIVWRERFTLYKRAIICFPDDYRTSLLAWYNEKLFGIVTASGAPSSSDAPEVGIDVVKSLVARIHQVNFKDLSEPSAPLSTLMGLSTPEPDLPVSFPGQTRQPTQVCAVPLDQVPSVLPPVGHATSGDTPSIIPVEVPAPRTTRRKAGKSKR